MITFDAEKQLIRIINSVRFIREKVLWFVIKLKILDLASIIRAATISLSRIKIEDIISIDEKIVID